MCKKNVMCTIPPNPKWKMELTSQSMHRNGSTCSQLEAFISWAVRGWLLLA